MKLVRQIILSLFLLLICSCGNTGNNANRIAEKQGEYPEIVDSLKVNKWYDDTKWYLYLLYCLDTPKIEMRAGDSVLVNQPYSSLDLRFDSLVVKSDSFLFYFDFYKNDDTLPINPNIYEQVNLGVNGLLFSNKVSDSNLCFVDNFSSLVFFCYPINKALYDTTTNRLIKPLQPDVVEYLNKHQKELNPWLLKEAKNRGIVK